MPLLAQQHVRIPTKDLISWIFEKPDYDLDRPIYIDAVNPSRTVSYNQARVLVRKLVAGFRAAGLQRGDCVCVHSFNDLYYSILFLGIVAAGGVFAGTNPSYTPFELTHHLTTSRAKFIISEPDLLDPIYKAAKQCDIPQSKIWIFDIHHQALPSGFHSWSELLNHGEEDWVRFNDKGTSERTAAALLFSSGTTGLPKAAIITHYNLVAIHTQMVDVDLVPHEIVRLAYLPMFHAACVPLGHTTPLKSGQVTLVMRRFDPTIFLSTIEKFKITDVTLMPPIVHALLASPLTKQYDLTSLKCVICGGAPLSKDRQEQFKSLLDKSGTFNQGYGMTETTSCAARFWWPEDDLTGSVGRFLANLDIRIVDNDGNDITGQGAKGELLLRGPNIIPGYYENPAANAAAFDSDGFFRTGDIVLCEEGDGVTTTTAKFWIMDRKKDLIKVRGFQVSPAELEAVVLQHPAVVDVTVIGVAAVEDSPDARDGEHPRAYVVCHPGSGSTVKVTEAEIKEWCAQRLAKYKALSGGVVFVDTIPRNAGGKVLRRLLRDDAAAPTPKL